MADESRKATPTVELAAVFSTHTTQLRRHFQSCIAGATDAYVRTHVRTWKYNVHWS